VSNPKNEGMPDLTWREKWTLIPLVVLALWIGIYPKPFFAIMDAPIQKLVFEQVVPVLRDTGVAIDLPQRAGAPQPHAAAGEAQKSLATAGTH
jgi:hypothetical protein